MTLNVHLTHPPENISALTDYLDSRIRVTTGESLPEGINILVGGRVDPEFIATSSSLRAVIVPWAGLPEAAGKILRQYPHITVHNSHHNAVQVAEMALALLLAAAKKIVPLDGALRTGDWSKRYERTPSVMLEGKTALILGFGEIGQRLGRMLKGLGMDVIGVRRSPQNGAPTGVFDELHSPKLLPELYPRANAFLITVPLTDETKNMIGMEELSQLPAGAILVNVGRGPVIQEKALYDSLKSGSLGAAGLDVWWNYPSHAEDRKSTYPSNFPYQELENVVLSPHRAGSIEEVKSQRLASLAQMLNAAARGEPIPNRVDVERGY